MKTFVSRIKALELHYQIHLLAFGLFATGVILQRTFPALKGAQHILLILALFGFGTGFAIWCRPTVLKIWAHPAGKVAISVLHLFVLLLAAVLARFVVASALGLPPQDFDLTVSFLTLILYVPAWSIVVSIIVGLVAIVLELVAILSSFFKSSRGEAAKIFANMMGAITICFLAGQIFDVVIKNQDILHPIVKWIAFASDFQPVTQYPGIGSCERTRLHENGVISCAHVHDGHVVIEVRNISGPVDT